MPSANPVLDPADAVRIAADRGFLAPPNGAWPDGTPTAARNAAARGAPTGLAADTERRAGIELEWCTVDLADPTRPADFDAVCRAAAMATIPHRSRVTYEPGGQIELSSPPLPRLDAITALADDAASLGRALFRAGIGMVAIGLEPGPRRERFLRSPRYDAMEAYFDAGGEAGRTMMRSTAALQLNLDLGGPAETQARWDLAHALGPVLAATFANSPFWNGGPSGWKSTRLAVWSNIDPSRTQPVANGVGGREAWARYALDAGVMLVHRSDTDAVALEPGLTFGEWIERGHPIGWPTVEDLEYHLTTLFPPVRPRGWFELRMVDALPAPWWRVAAAVTKVLFDDPEATARARDAVEPVRDRWADAARHGLADPAIAAAARACFEAARAGLDRHGADPVTVDAADEFADRFVTRGRCPADALLDACARDGTLLPRADNA